MVKKNRGNGNHNTRSKSKDKDRKQGAPPAAPSTPVSASQGTNVPSTICVGEIPSHNQNKDIRTVLHPLVSPKTVNPANLNQNNSSETLGTSGDSLTDNSHEKAIPENNRGSQSQLVRVSDNRETSIQTDFPPEFHVLFAQDSPITAMFDELKVIRARLDTMDKIETTTASLATHFREVAERRPTSKLEGSVKSNTKVIQEVKSDVSSFKTEVKGSIASNATDIKEVRAEVASLRETVEIQASVLAKLTTIKTDLFKQNKEVKSELLTQNQEIKNDLIKRSEGITGHMNKLIEQQKQQVETFHATTQKVEKKIMEKTEEKIEEEVGKVSKGISFQKLKDQAYANRHNIIIIGLEEDPDKSVRTVVTNLFKTLGEEKVVFKDAFRLGTPRNDSDYYRPVKVKFSQLVDRNRIWRKRKNITTKNGDRLIKIQADLPKELPEETGVLYRIIRAAAKMEKYKHAVIRNYAIRLQGKEYTPRDLERLPFPLRRSTISNPRSEEATVFFTKYPALSNHHPSLFNLQGHQFYNMEHYLVLKRAQLSG